MRTLPERYLSEIPVPKEAYEVDLAVLDRYQSFSAELLRLALLVLAGYGFLITNVGKASDSRVFFEPSGASRYVLAVGAVSLAVSAMCALGHRYFSTDSLTHHVRRLRLQRRLAEEPEDTAERTRLEKVIHQESVSLSQDLERCRRLLLWSSVSLLVGAVGVALSFALTLFAAK